MTDKWRHLFYDGLKNLCGGSELILTAKKIDFDGKNVVVLSWNPFSYLSQGVPAVTRSQGSQMNKGSQLNKESGVSDEQGAPS